MMTPEQQAAIDAARQRLAGALSPQQQDAIASARRRLTMQEGLGQLSDMSRNPQVPDPEPDMSLAGRFKDNLLGVDDGVESTGEKLANLLNIGGESMTLGVVGDEAAAGLDAMLGRGTYDERLKARRDQEADFREAHPVASTAADVGGALLPGLGMAGGAAKAAGAARAGLAGRVVGAGAGGGLASGVYGFMEGEGSGKERLNNGSDAAWTGGMVSAAIPVVGAGVQRAVRSSKAAALRRMFAEGVEGTDGLLSRARGLYDEARKLGAVAQKGHTLQMADDANRLLSREGLITPQGNVAEVPKVRHAFQMLRDFAGEQMNPEQMQTVRKSLQSAARSTDQAEARVGTMMLRQFDDAIDPLAPQFREANSLYRRAMKSERIQEVIDLAGNRAGQFSGSGYENALRTEFRALNRRIIKGQEKGFTADEKALIARIANGGTVENIARDIGKAAPRGVVSTVGAGGVPFAIGSTLGGPLVGAAMGAGSLVSGEVGRRAATAMQRKNAKLLEALVRSKDGVLPQIADQTGAGARKLIEGGLMGAVATR